VIRSVLGRARRRLGPKRPLTPFDEELGFWRTYLRDHGHEVCDRDSWEQAFPSSLLDYIETLRSIRGRAPRALELGSGPVSLLAWGVDQGLFEVAAVDPLAREYERLMRNVHCSYPVKPIQGFGEQLSARFAPDTFDLAYSSNALDHTASPRRCLEEMTQVVAAGGIIYCEGFVREGTNAGWQGLHQHDLVPENGHLVRYARQGSRSVVTDGLAVEFVCQRVQTLAERSLRSHGYGWDEHSERDWRSDAWYTLVFEVRSAA
jgi:SAM-dependent methyltransferase